VKYYLKRDILGNDRTLGVFESENSLFKAFSLEDYVRDDGIKIAGITAIPAGTYELYIALSPTHKEERIYLKNVPNFSGVQIHAGNSPEDVKGCISLAFNRDIKKGYIYKRADKILLNRIKASKEKNFLTISNDFKKKINYSHLNILLNDPFFYIFVCTIILLKVRTNKNGNN
jgi:hypothetical protein